jgi:hypothetical protein
VPNEYIVKRTGAFWEADVLLDKKPVAKLTKGDGIAFLVKGKDGSAFFLDPRVNGKIRPFSMIIYQGERPGGNIVLKIRNNLFSHNGQMYLMKNVPEGRKARDHLLGPKYITRLVNFPFEDPDDVDVHTSERLGRHRGVKVGEMSGLGINGHIVKVDGELDDIGLPLSVASYLIYASG